MGKFGINLQVGAPGCLNKFVSSIACLPCQDVPGRNANVAAHQVRLHSEESNPGV